MIGRVLAQSNQSPANSGNSLISETLQRHRGVSMRPDASSREKNVPSLHCAVASVGSSFPPFLGAALIPAVVFETVAVGEAAAGAGEVVGADVVGAIASFARLIPP